MLVRAGAFTRLTRSSKLQGPACAIRWPLFCAALAFCTSRWAAPPAACNRPPRGRLAARMSRHTIDTASMGAPAKAASPDVESALFFLVPPFLTTNRVHFAEHCSRVRQPRRAAARLDIRSRRGLDPRDLGGEFRAGIVRVPSRL